MSLQIENPKDGIQIEKFLIEFDLSDPAVMSVIVKDSSPNISSSVLVPRTFNYAITNISLASGIASNPAHTQASTYGITVDTDNSSGQRMVIYYFDIDAGEFDSGKNLLEIFTQYTQQGNNTPEDFSLCSVRVDNTDEEQNTGDFTDNQQTIIDGLQETIDDLQKAITDLTTRADDLTTRVETLEDET